MSDDCPVVPQPEEHPAEPERPGITSDNNPYAFASIVGVPARTARQIRQKAKRFLEKPDEFKTYAQNAAIVHALIMDWRARNASEYDEAKAAAESFLKISGTLLATKRK